MKVLIVYAQAGAGHKKAAEALDAYLKNAHPEISAKVIDILDYTPKFFKLLYSDGYTFLISRLAWLWYILYRLSFLFSKNPLFAYFDYITSQPFIRRLQKEKYEIVLSTHFLANNVISVYKKKHPESPLRLISIITDYNLHPIWIGEGVDVYIVSCDYVENELIRRGMRADKIKDYGIPAHPKFYSTLERKEAALRLGANPAQFTVLIMTGTFGIGPIEEIVKSLAGNLQLLVICGRNRQLYNRLCALRLNLVKVYSLIDNVDELMSVSDVVLTKAGGLTITESLAKGVPMVFFSNIPGLETANAEVIAKYGAGFTTENIEDIKSVIFALRDNRVFYENALRSIKKISSANTLEEISHILLDF